MKDTGAKGSTRRARDVGKLGGTLRLLATVLATAREHYALIDREKRYRFASASALETLSLSAAQLTGRTWRELGQPAAVMEPMEARWDQVLQTGGSVQDEIDYPTAAGLRTFEYQLDPVRASDGEVAGVLIAARDVTGQRQIERALRESEDRYRRVVTTAAVPIMLHADDGEVLAVSDGLLAATGYTRGQLRHFADWLVLAYRDQADEIGQRVRRRFRELLPVPGVELRVHTAYGEVRTWVWTAPPPERLTDGRYCLFTIANDITERKRIIDALRISEERYRLAAAAVDGIVYDWDLVADRVERSPQIAELLGIPLHDIPAQAAWWSQRVHPADLGRIRAEAARIAGQGGTRYRCEYRVRHADSTWRTVVDHAFLVRDTSGSVVRVVGVTTDVTARRHAERALRESEERLRLARDAAQIGIHDLDVASGTIGWDARVRELWAVPPELPITYEVFMAGVHPGDRVAVQLAVDRALDPRGEGFYSAEYRVIGIGDGVERWINATGRVTFTDGRPARLVGTVTDETARKTAEAKLRELAEQRDALLQELHHRVKNNLQLIGSLLHLQAKRSGDPAMQDFVQRAVGRIAAMGATYDILNRGPMSGKVEVGSYVRELCDVLAASYADADSQLEMSIGHEDLVVDSGKAVTLGLIVNELVTNAFKHGLAAQGAKKIEVGLHPQAPGWWDLTVSNEHGMAEAAGVPTPSSHGLGLQLVSLFTEQLGGSLQIRTEGGYKVRVTLKTDE